MSDDSLIVVLTLELFLSNRGFTAGVILDAEHTARLTRGQGGQQAVLWAFAGTLGSRSSWIMVSLTSH